MTGKQIGIGIALIIAGMIISPKGGTVEKVVEVPAQCEVQECNADQVKAHMISLRDLDNEGFGLAGRAMGACSDMVTAAASFDAAEIEKQTQVIYGITDEFTTVSAKRNQLLEEAGIPNE